MEKIWKKLKNPDGSGVMSIGTASSQLKINSFLTGEPTSVKKVLLEILAEHLGSKAAVPGVNLKL